MLTASFGLQNICLPSYPTLFNMCVVSFSKTMMLSVLSINPKVIIYNMVIHATYRWRYESWNTLRRRRLSLVASPMATMIYLDKNRWFLHGQLFLWFGNGYPLVNVYTTMENPPFYSWVNQLFLWPFSTAMIVYQRGKASTFQGPDSPFQPSGRMAISGSGFPTTLLNWYLDAGKKPRKHRLGM
jgi:hypothetical protein